MVSKLDNGRGMRECVRSHCSQFTDLREYIKDKILSEKGRLCWSLSWVNTWPIDQLKNYR